MPAPGAGHGAVAVTATGFVLGLPAGGGWWLLVKGGLVAVLLGGAPAWVALHRRQ